MPGLIRPPDSRSTVARSSASRSGFSQASGVTAVPSSIRDVRWDAAAMIATGEETPYCRCRCRSQARVEAELLAELELGEQCLHARARVVAVEDADGEEAELLQGHVGRGHVSGQPTRAPGRSRQDGRARTR